LQGCPSGRAQTKRGVYLAVIWDKSIFGWEFTAWGQVSHEAGKKPEGSELVIFHKGNTHGSLINVEPPNRLSPAMHPDNPDKKRIAVRVMITVGNVDATLEIIEKAVEQLTCKSGIFQED